MSCVIVQSQQSYFLPPGMSCRPHCGLYFYAVHCTINTVISYCNFMFIFNDNDTEGGFFLNTVITIFTIFRAETLKKNMCFIKKPHCLSEWHLFRLRIYFEWYLLQNHRVKLSLKCFNELSVSLKIYVSLNFSIQI